MKDYTLFGASLVIAALVLATGNRIYEVLIQSALVSVGILSASSSYMITMGVYILSGIFLVIGAVLAVFSGRKSIDLAN